MTLILLKASSRVSRFTLILRMPWGTLRQNIILLSQSWIVVVAGPDLELMQGCQSVAIFTHWHKLYFLQDAMELLTMEFDEIFVSRLYLIRRFDVVGVEHDWHPILLFLDLLFFCSDETWCCLQP